MESISDGQLAVGGASERQSLSLSVTAEIEHREGNQPVGSRRHTVDAALDRALGIARQGDFARFWGAEAISAVGSQFTAVALPLLAALRLDSSPMAVGALAAAAGLPHLLFGLFAGAWIDRLRRRPVMIAADLGRAAMLATIPLAAWLGALRIELLTVVAFLAETHSVFFDIAY